MFRMIVFMNGLQALNQLSTTYDNRLRRFGAIVLVLLLSYWAYQLIREYPTGQTPWIFLDYINLLFHEAGHLIWMPLGQFWAIAGGSITQILIPVIVLVTFIWHKDLLGAGFGLFWVGNNLVNVSYYIVDAQMRLLPLLGGDSSIHDWNWLLVSLGLLDKAEILGLAVRYSGIIFILLAIGCTVLAALTMKNNRVYV